MASTTVYLYADGFQIIISNSDLTAYSIFPHNDPSALKINMSQTAYGPSSKILDIIYLD